MSPPAALPGWLAPLLLCALTGIALSAILSIGFFADDFHMLDVARRYSLGELLAGHHGIYPWYRPLSRELVFSALAVLGPAAVTVARAFAIAVVAATAWQLHGIGTRLASARAGAIAAALFAAYGTTRFLAAWTSGLQDLLAILFVLTAVHDALRGRSVPALLWAFIAVFCKESAFVVFPLLALSAWRSDAQRRDTKSWLALMGTAAVAIVLHVAVRMSWHSGGRQIEIVRSLPELGLALVRVLTGFAGAVHSPEPSAVVTAALALAATATFVWAAGRAPDAPKSPEPAVMFVLVAIALGLAPLIGGHLAGVTTPSSYYAFAAVPWLALALGMALARLGGALGIALVAALVGWNMLALGAAPPDLSRPAAWEHRDWDWPEAVRLSAISSRLGSDLRVQLAARPDSAVVLFCDLPKGCFFQSEDGPATRESLRDRTVRSYWLNATPYGVDPDRFVILSLDHETSHLVPYALSREERGKLTASSVAAGEPAPAWAYSQYGDPAENHRFEFAYYRAAAALMAEGVPGMRRELAAIGLDDTTGSAPERWTLEAVGPGGPLHAAMLGVLRRPTDARAHVALATACRAAGAVVFEGVELRYAVTLDPGLHEERLRLAQSLMANGKPGAAKADLSRLLTEVAGTPLEARTRDALAATAHAATPEPFFPGAE